MSLRLFITEPLTLRFASASMDDEFGVKKIAPIPSTARESGGDETLIQ